MNIPAEKPQRRLEMMWPTHNPTEPGWVATITARFLCAGYRHIYLKTDAFRLPAIKTYLKLGYWPTFHVDGEDHAARWKSVCEKLHWPLGN